VNKKSRTEEENKCQGIVNAEFQISWIRIHNSV
jgi:hypothetical protein